MQTRKRNISRLVWCAKAIAILTVIVAHSDFRSAQSDWFAMLIDRIGSMGVPVFLLLSAYYYRPQKYSSCRALLKSRISTVIPWLVLAIVCYFWSYLRMGKIISVQSCIQFVFGYNSIFYFVTVLLALQLLFYFIRSFENKGVTSVCILVSVVSTEFAAFGITDAIIGRLGLTNYLNILNWLGFFAIGTYFQKKTEDEILGNLKKSTVWAALIWCMLFVIGRLVERGQYGYFSVLGIYMETASAILILRLAWSICHCDWVVRVGKYSFSIYLVHINIVPVVNKFLGGTMLGELISPLCTYGITVFLIWCACMVLKEIRLGQLTKYLLGVRID